MSDQRRGLHPTTQPPPDASDASDASDAPTHHLLSFLGLAREPPSLDCLHRLVREHQARVPFETLTKLIDYEPGLRRLDQLQSDIAAANDWGASQSFLHRLVFARPVDGVFTSYRDGTLTRYLASGPERVDVDPREAAEMLAQVFGADPDLCREAAAVQRRFARGAGT